MANGSAPIAVNLCIPTASALQDYFCVDCFANHRVEVATAQSLDTQFGVSLF